MSVKSVKAQAFLRQAIYMLQAGTKPYPPIARDEKLFLRCIVRYPDYRRDVDCSLVEDALQRAGIVPNDRQFRLKHFEAEDEVGEPEIRITIQRLGLLPWNPRQPQTRDHAVN